MKLADYINSLGLGVQAETTEYGTTEIVLTDVEQDFRFEVEKASDIYSYWEDYDVDEEVEMFLEAKRNGFQGVPTVSVLVKECEQVDATLEELAIKTFDFKEV